MTRNTDKSTDATNWTDNRTARTSGLKPRECTVYCQRCGDEFEPVGHPTRPVSVKCDSCDATGTINHNRFGRITGTYGAVATTEADR